MAHDGTGTGWDVTAPADADDQSAGAQEIRDLRKATAIRVNKEHVTLATSSAGGEHLNGSAKAYHDDSADADALLRPDGTTSLASTADDGRLLIEDGTGSRAAGQVVYWVSDAWADVQIALANMTANSVDSAQYVDASIDIEHFASGVFTADAPGRTPFANGVIDTAQLATDAVTTVKITDGNVTNAKLANNYLSLEDHVLLRHVVADDDDGGTGTSGAWRTRPLNEETDDPNTLCSLAANQFTLTAGTYIIRAWSIMFNCGAHQCKLYNATGAATIDNCIGTVMDTASTGTAQQNASILSGQFTIAAAQALELQYQCGTTKPDNGLGRGAGYGEEEIFAIVELWKVG